MLSEFSRDIARERFKTKKFPQKSMVGSQYQGKKNPCLKNPRFVKNYSSENLENLHFDLPQTKQPSALTNFNQFCECACQNTNNFRASIMTSLPLLRSPFAKFFGLSNRQMEGEIVFVVSSYHC